MQGTLAPTPQLSLQVEGASAGRLGGVGSVEATLTRRGRDGVAVTNARVRISGPVGTRMTGGSGAGWFCIPSGRVIDCRHPGSIAARRNPASIIATFSVASSANRLARAAQADFVSSATWAGDPADAEIAGPWLETDSGSAIIHDRLGLSLVSGAGSSIQITTGTDAAFREVVLEGAITGADTGAVQAEWSQLAGPTVQMLTGATVEGAPDRITQTIVFPDTATGTQTYVFGLRASSDGQTVERPERGEEVRGVL